MHLLSYFSLTPSSDYFLSSCLMFSFAASFALFYSIHSNSRIVFGQKPSARRAFCRAGISVQNSTVQNLCPELHMNLCPELHMKWGFASLASHSGPLELSQKVYLQVENPPERDLTWHEDLQLKNENVKQKVLSICAWYSLHPRSCILAVIIMKLLCLPLSKTKFPHNGY